jgi:16S rRNA (uracil1498-N3)-methyltransferase
MSLPVFLHPGVTGVVAGQDVELTGDEARHAVVVRRIRAGEQVALTDGAGTTAVCTVVSAEASVLGAEVESVTTTPAELPRVVVVQAIPKGDRGELAVELATEAGVDAVLPWRAARCVARWDDGPRGDKALARWRSTVLAATKQSRRAWLPEVGEPLGTAELTARCAAADAALVLHESAGESIAAAVRELLPTARPGGGPDAAPAELLLVVGPEGGITDDELASLCAVGARPVRLGPEVLRASTAAAVALGALGVLTGRWHAYF